MHNSLRLEELAERIELAPDAIVEITRCANDLSLCMRDAELIALFREDEQAFFSALRESSSWKQDALRIYMKLACDAYGGYSERGIDDKIYFDTMRDITIWERECMRKYSLHGLEEVEWLARHLRLDLFCLGGLQFEPVLLEEPIRHDRAGHWEKGTLALNVHIPEGADLKREACEDAFRRAKEFFGSSFDLFICDSWLLAPDLGELLPETSRIIEFQKMFDIVGVHHSFAQAEQRIFKDVLEDKSQYPQRTSLQRSAREYFMAGGDPGIGIGVIPMVRCMPFMSELKCMISGINVREYESDPALMAEAEVCVYDRFKPDRIVIGPNTRGIASALGAEFIYPDGGTPYVGSQVINCRDDIYSINAIKNEKSPWAANPIEQLEVYTSAAKMLRRRLPWWTRIEMSIGGPFTIASMLMGTERLLRECRKDSDSIHHLLRLITDTQKTCIDLAADCGCGIAMADPVANPELIGPGMYEEFVFPVTMELTEYAASATGRKVSLHMCGRTYSIWRYLSRYPLEELSLDNLIDLKRAAVELGPHVRIAGNVDPVGIILNGSREDIAKAAAECIEYGRQAERGFTVATGCDVPETTDPVKIDWLMEAVRNQGQ